MTELRIKATKVFQKLNASKKRIVVARGGTRAGKTYAIMQMFAFWLLFGIFRGVKVGKTASVVRATLPSLKATAMKDFKEILVSWGFYEKIEHNKTDKIYTYEDRELDYFSVDDEQKVRGRKRDILFCNEGNELIYETEFFQLNIRTAHCIFIDFNPSDPYIWIKEEIEDKRAVEMEDVESFIFTYLDNGFLTNEQRREIEAIKDETLRQVYVHGQYGIVKGLIFPQITLVDSFPQQCERIAIGLDFGYTNDPTAAILCGVIGDNLYLDELVYEYALTNDQIAKRLDRKIEVYADSAEPKSIEELKRFGLRVFAAQKGKDSIQFGINTLKQYNLHITARSYNLLKEQKLYKYKTESNGQPSNDPIDDFNHAWDAVRYYALTKLNKPLRNIIKTF